MKCINCFSRFIRKPIIKPYISEDIASDTVSMATWDDNYWYGGSLKDLGLKTCPFNSSHRIKASNYEKHVLKCEQQFPKTLNRCSDGLSSRRTISTSIESFFDNNSEIDGLTKAFATDFIVSEDWTEEVNQIPVPLSVELWNNQTLDSREAKSSNRSGSPDSAIGMASDTNSSQNVIQTEVEVNANVNDLDSSLTVSLTQTSAQTQSTDNSQPTERLTDRSPNRSQAVPIAPQQVEIIPEPSNTSNPSDEGSGDPNDWTSGQPYSLYTGYENMDDLTDEQIMEMADNFMDTAVVSKMSKSQRKELNDKRIQLKREEKQRKQKAFNELITYTDLWDPEMNDIPQEIRKPRVDVRQLFNLNKRIDTLMSNTPISPEPNDCPPNPWTNGDSSIAQPFGSHVQCVPSKDECSTDSDDCHVLSAVCNNCWDPLALTEENLKRMTIFCATCSGIKFGGYFECQSCNLYGYFANSQISKHLTKHYPQTN